MTIRETLRNLGTRFDKAGLDSPALLARKLTAHVLQQPREYLIAHDDVTLTQPQLVALEALVQRALAHEPLAYILQTRAFYGMDLYVDKRVLVPRPETEMLVELALAHADGGPVLEIGTGSGAAAIAIARARPGWSVIATDVSADALAVARINAQRHGTPANLTFAQSDLLSTLPADLLRHTRVLVSNLPYVAAQEIDMLQPEIADFEPRVALDGGPDGLDLIRELLRQLRDQMLPHGNLRVAYFEHGASQGPACVAIARETLPAALCKTIKDLARLDRVLSVTIAEG